MKKNEMGFTCSTLGQIEQCIRRVKGREGMDYIDAEDRMTLHSILLQDQRVTMWKKVDGIKMHLHELFNLVKCVECV